MGEWRVSTVHVGVGRESHIKALQSQGFIVQGWCIACEWSFKVGGEASNKLLPILNNKYTITYIL